MKPVFRTDLSMAILTLVSLFTGIQIHYAGHFQSHEVWHNWSVVHTIANIALLVIATIHIKQHRGFYKSLCNGKNISRRVKITMLVTTSFVVVALSGICLLAFVKGSGSSAGLAHYIMGIVFSALGMGHLAKRWKVFKKGVVK